MFIILFLLYHTIVSPSLQGLALSAKDSEVRELMAKLHQTELNNTLQQDLLKHMMADRVDIEVDNLMTNQVDGMFVSIVTEFLGSLFYYLIYVCLLGIKCRPLTP